MMIKVQHIYSILGTNLHVLPSNLPVPTVDIYRKYLIASYSSIFSTSEFRDQALLPTECLSESYLYLFSWILWYQHFHFLNMVYFAKMKMEDLSNGKQISYLHQHRIHILCWACDTCCVSSQLALDPKLYKSRHQKSRGQLAETTYCKALQKELCQTLTGILYSQYFSYCKFVTERQYNIAQQCHDFFL